MENIKEYHLHKYDHSKFQFEVYNTKDYYLKNKLKASKAHRHSYYQLIWFKKPGKHYIDYEVIEHPEEVIFFINKDQVHYFCKDSPNEGLLFHFNDLFLNQYNMGLDERYALSVFNEIGTSYVKFNKEELSHFMILSGFIKDEIRLRKNLYREKVFHYFQPILLEVERLKRAQGLKGIKQSEDFNLAISFKKLVQKRINEFMGIDVFASLLNTNSKNLTAICKTYFYKTPAEFIKEMKILEAKRLLANEKVSIKEIAYILGFEQPTYFTKYFKKATSLTPKQFQSSLL